MRLVGSPRRIAGWWVSWAPGGRRRGVAGISCERSGRVAGRNVQQLYRSDSAPTRVGPRPSRSNALRRSPNRRRRRIAQRRQTPHSNPLPPAPHPGTARRDRAPPDQGKQSRKVSASVMPPTIAFAADAGSCRAIPMSTIQHSEGVSANLPFATHSPVGPRAGGRLHRPDDAQVEPREARRRTPRYCFCRASDYWFATASVVSRQRADDCSAGRCASRAARGRRRPPRYCFLCGISRPVRPGAIVPRRPTG